MPALRLHTWPPAPIVTERLVIRAPEASDRDGFISLLTSPDARHFLGGPIAAADAHAATLGPYGRTPGSFAATLADTGTFVGTVGLDRRDGNRPGHLHPGGLELEISYVLDPALWGRGYATEAVTAVLEWASAVLPDDEIVACTQVVNTASAGLLRRLGFTEVDRFVEFAAQQSLWSRPLAGKVVPPQDSR